MLVKLKWLMAAFLVLVAMGARSASAQVRQFTERTTFEASSMNRTDLAFENLAPAGGSVYYGDPGSLSLSGVTFRNNSPLFVQNTARGSFLSAQQARGAEVVTIMLPAGTTAVGFDYVTDFPITVTLSTGDSFDFCGSPFPNYSFLGFTSRVPIASLRITVGGDGIDLDNFAFGQQASAQGPQKQVRIVYLIPSDRTYRPEYRSALENALTNLRAWVREQMGNNSTFSTHAPVVEAYRTCHPAAFYQTNPARPGFDAGRFWEATLADGFAFTGGKFDDPNNRWVFYIDADPLAGQGIGGTNGVAVLAANDLRGLTGQPLVPINPGDSSVNPGVNRWIGGLGHELGHAFGLPHPVPNNVTAQVRVVQGGFRKNRTTGRYVQRVDIRNAGSNALPGPLSLVLDALSVNATLFAATGRTVLEDPTVQNSTGQPYLSVPASAAGNGNDRFEPGETVTLTLEFVNVTDAAIRYTPRVIAGPVDPDQNALMYLGYLTYPQTYLRPSDRSALQATGFFSP